MNSLTAFIIHLVFVNVEKVADARLNDIGQIYVELTQEGVD